MSNRLMGTVKWYNDEKGFGVITPHGEDYELFFHYGLIEFPKSPYDPPKEGQTVSFVVEKGHMGTEQAAHVRFE